jgi:hypothetical protein
MTCCANCGRTLKNEPVMLGGLAYGPKCAKSAHPVPAVGRDLFGYDIDAAVESALFQVHGLIESRAAEARIALRHGFAAARRRLMVWS